jgi:hypothetical protein
LRIVENIPDPDEAENDIKNTSGMYRLTARETRMLTAKEKRNDQR